MEDRKAGAGHSETWLERKFGLGFGVWNSKLQSVRARGLEQMRLKSIKVRGLGFKVQRLVVTHVAR